MMQSQLVCVFPTNQKSRVPDFCQRSSYFSTLVQDLHTSTLIFPCDGLSEMRMAISLLFSSGNHSHDVTHKVLADLDTVKGKSIWWWSGEVDWRLFRVETRLYKHTWVMFLCFKYLSSTNDYPTGQWSPKHGRSRRAHKGSVCTFLCDLSAEMQYNMHKYVKNEF